MSESEPIHVIIPRIKAEVGAVGKTSRNATQGFDFRGVDDVVNAISDVLIEHGVTVFPVATTASYRDVQTSNDKRAHECTTSVVYRWLGPAGDYIDSQVAGSAMDSGDKATPKAMSVAYRTALLQTLTLPTGDRDPDADSYQRSASTPEPTPSKLRTQIAEIAGRKGMSLDAVAEDFERHMSGADIARADVATLAEYRSRINGYLAAGSTSHDQ